MPAEPIVIENQGKKIFGMRHLPEKGGSLECPMVLFFHGFLAAKTEAHRIFVKVSRLLEKEGIGSLRIDFSGCGESEGESVDVSIDSLISDAEKALSYLKKQPFVNPKKIAVLGMSLGGGIAATLAGKHPELAALVLWAPVANLLECTQIKIGDQESTHILQAPFIDYGGEFVGQKFLSQIASFNPVIHLEEFTNPVKLIQGTGDLTVPPHQSELYEKVFFKKNKLNHRHLILNADHQFSSAVWQEELFKETVTFLKKVWA